MELDVGGYLQRKSTLIEGVLIGDPLMLKLVRALRTVERKDGKGGVSLLLLAYLRVFFILLLFRG